MTTTIHPVDATAGAPVYNGRMLRQVGSVALAGATAARPFGARSGVRLGTSVTTVTATSTTWTVKAHGGVIDYETAIESGPTSYAIDADVTGTVRAADAFARVDLIWVRQDIPLEDGSAAPAAVPGYTFGTVASTAPALPARCLLLAWVNVPASGGGSPTVVWKAPYVVAAGGILPVPAAADYPASPYVGQVVDNAALGYSLRWSGSAWVPTVEVFTGLEGVLKGTVPPAGTRKIRYEGSVIYTTNAFGQFAVTFPVAFPNGIVSLVCTPGDTAASFGQAQVIRANTTNATGVGNAFTVTGAAINSLAICVNYVAIGW